MEVDVITRSGFILFGLAPKMHKMNDLNDDWYYVDLRGIYNNYAN
jgi:hypothetical protein